MTLCKIEDCLDADVPQFLGLSPPTGAVDHHLLKSFNLTQKETKSIQFMEFKSRWFDKYRSSETPLSALNHRFSV